MENTLTVVKTQVGMFAGIISDVCDDKSGKQICLNEPVAFEIMMIPTEGAVQRSVVFNPQWICYQLWTPKIEINLTGTYLIYEISLKEDNFIGNIYKRAISQEKKSRLH